MYWHETMAKCKAPFIHNREEEEERAQEESALENARTHHGKKYGGGAFVVKDRKKTFSSTRCDFWKEISGI